MFWIATAIFVAAYAVIVSEKIHKTKVALFGAALTLATKVLTQHDALHDVDLGVDWNVIFLLISMFGLMLREPKPRKHAVSRCPAAPYAVRNRLQA